MSKPHEAFDEETIEAAIAEVMARYEGVIPPEKQEEIRRSLRFGLRTHPHAQRLLRRLRPRGDVKESGTVATAEAEEMPEDAARESGGQR